MTYSEKLSQRITTIDSQLCIGIDPRADLIDRPLADFVRHIVDSTAESAAAYKPNAAYFEAFGAEGFKVLEDLVGYIPKEIPIVLDAKRSDIPETMKYYEKAFFDGWDVDAVTLNGYMGFDSIEPFLGHEGKGVYVLGVTSNPGAADIELQKTGDRYVFELIQDYARKADGMPGDVGMVIGLTNVSDDVLSRVADIPLLVPGLGAQGGDLSRLDLATRRAPMLINSSRSILYGEIGTPAGRAVAARDKIREAAQAN